MGAIGENILNAFFYNYFIMNDVKAIDSIISTNFKGVGTSQFELAFNKKEMIESIKNQSDNLKGKISFYLTNYTEDCFGDIISSYCEVNIIYFDREEKKMVTRLTTVFHREDNSWKIINMHNSLAENTQKEEEIFPINYTITPQKNTELELYLPCKYKKGIFKIEEIDFITYSSSDRKAVFHLKTLENFEVKRNFAEVEEKLESISFFYKVDRGTIINLKNIEILDFKEERILFKSKNFLYTSKLKLKDIEIKWIYIKDSNKIEI